MARNIMILIALGLMVLSGIAAVTVSYPTSPRPAIEPVYMRLGDATPKPRGTPVRTPTATPSPAPTLVPTPEPDEPPNPTPTPSPTPTMAPGA